MRSVQGSDANDRVSLWKGCSKGQGIVTFVARGQEGRSSYDIRDHDDGSGGKDDSYAAVAAAGFMAKGTC
jgi:hypothetical protein